MVTVATINYQPVRTNLPVYIWLAKCNVCAELRAMGDKRWRRLLINVLTATAPIRATDKAVTAAATDDVTRRARE